MSNGSDFVDIRRATALDIPRMMTVNQASLPETYPRCQWEAIVRDIGRGLTLVAIDKKNKKMCHGYALLYRILEKPCPCAKKDDGHQHTDDRCEKCRAIDRKQCPQWRLGSFAVAERSRGKGVGTLLFTAIVEMIRDEEILRKEEHRPHVLTLHVRESNRAARSLYEKFGLEMMGRSLEYYEDKEDGIFMGRFIQ